MDNEKRTVEEVDQFIENLPPDIQNIAAALRKLIFDSSPELQEEFKWSMPNYSHQGLVCYLQAAKKHVNLGFHKGKELGLPGTGKMMRHIRIQKLEDIKPEAFTSLIQQAVELNKKS